LLLASAAFGLVSGYLGPAPAAIIADIAPKGTAGAVMGLYRMSGDFGLLLGPIIIGWAAGQIGVGATFVGIACFTLLVAVFGFSARETLHEVQRN
jgi:MFS family permease